MCADSVIPQPHIEVPNPPTSTSTSTSTSPLPPSAILEMAPHLDKVLSMEDFGEGSLTATHKPQAHHLPSVLNLDPRRGKAATITPYALRKLLYARSNTLLPILAQASKALNQESDALTPKSHGT